MAELTHYIGGTRVAGTSGRFADVFNPATGEVQAKVPLATQAELDFKRLTELVNEPSTKPVLVVKLRRGLGYRDPEGSFSYYILDGHHRVASARLRGVNVEAVVVG